MNPPTGYFPFHKDSFINYQLNRWYSLGYTRKEDIARVGAATKTYGDYVGQFIRLAEEAVAQARPQNGAFYYRAAEFLVPPGTGDKVRLYDEFRDLFYIAFEDERIERHEIPYDSAALPAIRLSPRSDAAKGVLIGFGGFDSFMEEFFWIWQGFAEAGYEVIAFEGPGQGGALRKYGLSFDHDWEKPTAAVLDYFNASNAVLLGISMGGYWSIRAAAFEKRIGTVISFPPVYDWLEMASPLNARLVRALIKWRNLMNFLVRVKMTNRRLKHIIEHILFISQRRNPIDAVDWLLGMNKKHLHSERVDQHVLLLGSENDAFQRPILIRKQQMALINARSVTARIFKKEDHADQHCAIGNIGLALHTMIEWLEEVRQ